MTRRQLAIRIALGVALAVVAILLGGVLGENWQRVLTALGGTLGLGILVVDSTLTHRRQQKRRRELTEEAEVYEKHRRGL
ncbi:hypothetical protein FB561_2956 [Kribbella amoyensis]|uniref:Uncharacterized protein n=1 Tax=Kribbella amoyensis TaxID=996641 RepID=A0A561BST6_9ACTN|nr:hypothetical protein [Kribbella amoyensis]TWD81833.1 hypothetical protein FB561_2956 [Kribbella amoyensis]